MKVSAVIFDLDGTVLSNEDEWGRAFGNVLRKLGVKNVSYFPHIGGIGIKENWPYLIKKYNIKVNMTLDELAALTKTEYEKLIPKVTLKKGFTNFINDLKDSGILRGLATSGSWDMLEKVFDHIDIENDFDSITTGEEVFEKKPDPQIFELSAEKLGVDPSTCLVIEDSPAGIKAAHRAGMKVVAMARDKNQKDELKDADYIISDFDDLTPEVISQI